MKINWVDIIIVIFLVRAFIAGKKQGFSVELITLITAGFAWLAATHFYQPMGQFINKRLLLSLPAADDLAFGVLGISLLFLGVFLGKRLKNVMKLSFSGNIETIGGLIAGGMRGFIIAAIIIVFLALMPASFVQREVYSNSFIGNYLVALTPKVHQWLWPGGAGAKSSFSTRAYWEQLPERPKKEIL